MKGELGLDLVPGTGFLCAPVPGAFDAWALMLRDHGTWRLRDVLTTPSAMPPAAPMWWPGSPPPSRRCGRCSRPNGRPPPHCGCARAAPQPGALYTNPELAETYSRVVREAEAASSDRDGQIEAARGIWYGGFVAEAIDRFGRSFAALDTSGRRHHALLTADDMAGWRASVERPVTHDYRGHTVLKCGPWSQGPAMLQTLALLEGFDIGAMDPVGAEFVHTVAEAMKLAFADREAFYGDPNFTDVPMRALLAADYTAARRALIGREANNDFRPGSPEGRAPRTDYAAAVQRRRRPRHGRRHRGADRLPPRRHSGGDTCHIDVIDRFGNFVSATPSAGWLQSSPAIPGLGFCLGSRCQMFWLDESLPNGLKPGKRPRTTLSPSLVLRDGKPWMSFGTPGGEQQDQWQPIMLARMLRPPLRHPAGDRPAELPFRALDQQLLAARREPGKLVLEGRYDAAVLAGAAGARPCGRMGGEWSEGRLTGARLEADGQIFAGANPRGMQGYAVGR